MMPYYITKTGLDAFDTARAWGLGVVLNVITGDEVRITNMDWAYIVEPVSAVPTVIRLSGNTAWASLFQEENWQRVFMTAKGGWSGKRDQARQIIEQQIGSLLTNLQNPANTIALGTGESLPGGLDPTGFKGLRHATRAQYQEGQLNVLRDHWALACLGMATCGTYRYAKEAGQANWLVLLPVPQQVRFSYFRDVQDLFRLPGLKYHGVQNAAAHYAVQLAERLRRRAAAQGSLQDRYSAVLYFRLFVAGQQTKPAHKPAQGNQLRLEPLMEAIARDPHKTQSMLEWLHYCFRLGSTKGAEDLALAATELVMRWDLDAYERLVRILVRYQAQGRIRRDNLPEARTLEEVTHHVSV
jgi:hypothetical protein